MQNLMAKIINNCNTSIKDKRRKNLQVMARYSYTLFFKPIHLKGACSKKSKCDSVRKRTRKKHCRHTLWKDETFFSIA
jgi:hypothetical protein